jgi:hypothetical protein
LNTELTIKIKFNSGALAASPQTPPFSIEISPALQAAAAEAAGPSGPLPLDAIAHAVPEAVSGPAPASVAWPGAAGTPPAPQPLSEMAGMTMTAAGPDPMAALGLRGAGETPPEPIPLDELEAMLGGEPRGGPPAR